MHESTAYYNRVPCLSRLQRWQHLTTPVWGRHHLEYLSPETGARLLPPAETKSTLLFESVNC